MRGVQAAGGAAVLAVLAGCVASSPDVRIAELAMDVPSEWQADPVARGGVDGAWIGRFGDPVLDRLVDEAVAGNRDLQAAAARLGQAAAATRIAGAPLRPKLDARGSGERYKRNFIGFPDFGPPGGGEEGGAGEVLSTRDNALGVSLDVNWELDVWGRIRAGQSAYLADEEAVAAEVEAARISLAAQVAKAYFGLIEAGQQLALAEQTVETFRATEQATRDRFELGQNEAGGLAASLRLSMSDVATAEAAVEERRAVRDRAVRQLELLLGRYPAGLLEAPRELPAVPSRPPAGLPSELLARRPDVLAAERRFAAAGARQSEARRALFPRLALTGSAGRSTDDLDSLLDSDFGVWNLAGNLAQPILTGGELRGGIELRNAEEREALALLQQTVLAAFSEVEIALSVEEALARRQEALERAVALAEEADREARADYRDAVGDILTVFAAQNRNLNAKASLILVRRVRLDNRINLHLALGGDFRARGAGN